MLTTPPSTPSPALNVTLPPAPRSALDAPAAKLTAPAEFAVLSPTETVNEPALPEEEEPVFSRIEPESDTAAEPVASDKPPLSPAESDDDN
jgi:hypothetical protein